MREMSFSQKVKEELCQNEYSSDRLRALLASYIRINGSLIFRDKKALLNLKSENAKISRFIYETIQKIYQIPVELSFLTKTNLNKNKTYIITTKDDAQEIMEDLDISFLEGKISKNIVKNDDTISGYLAGAFLASGSVNSPKTSSYHLEIAVNNENYAKWLSKLFGKYHNSDIEPKIAKRREQYIVYFKKSDQIANFLIMIGAVISCMDFENYRVDRDFSNSANRLTNMDTANMKKTLETAARQINEIKLIDEKLGIKNMTNVKAKTLCELRLEFENMNMNELALEMSKRLNHPITKSNVNHLFRYIHSLWETLSS
ncbi:MAG: DNA-binding protein WhiA [Bacilli bacterium]|nr:DNA-binding protein WhiA [Bacilli bacterium]